MVRQLEDADNSNQAKNSQKRGDAVVPSSRPASVFEHREERDPEVGDEGEEIDDAQEREDELELSRSADEPREVLEEEPRRDDAV